MRVSGLLLMIFLLAGVAAAQPQDPPPVISAANVQDLEPVARLRFDALPDGVGPVDSGWFAMSADGSRYAVLDRDGAVLTWDLSTGEVAISLAACDADGRPGAFIDGVFHDSLFVAVYAAGLDSYTGYHPFESGTPPITLCGQPDTPLRVWTDANGWNWYERVSMEGESTVTGFPLPLDCGQPEGPVCEDRAVVLPSGPENDRESYLRIGRVEAPLAVTATQDGLVKRWNLETGAVTATAQVEGLPGIGQVNYGGAEAGRYFAWVDGAGEALNLLDFETGENRSITALNGTSVPFLWLASGADVILGVHTEEEPVIAAWNAATGERYDLGVYQVCGRPPDMVRLNRDGTTLAIGCDTGLEVWRVQTGD